MNLFTFNEITSFLNMMFCYFCSFFFLLIIQVESQYEFNEDKLDKIVWCTKNIEEQYKCLNLTSAVERDKLLFEDTFLNLTCHKAFSAEECIQSIDHEKAHITTLDAGDVFTAGRFHSLIPIMQEKFQGGFTDYHSVAVIKKNTLTDVNRLSDLKNKKACFPWVGSLAGWTIPIYVLQQDRAMEVIDCNNQVKTASNFFNDSCAIFSLTDKYNPIGDNSDKLCTLCGGKTPGSRCTASDPYYGYDGAFRCLVEVGDVAFLRHSTVLEQLQGKEFKNLSPNEFELLCRDGRRVPLEEFRQCSWGLVPSDAVVTSSARPLKGRNKFQKFLKTVMKLYSDNDNAPFTSKTNYTYDGSIYMKNQNQNLNEYGNYDSGNTYRTNLYSKSYSPNTPNSKPVESSFRIFDSQNYTKHNLLFQDSAVNLAALMEDDQSFSKYLQNATKYIFGIRECPVPSMILCVTSDQELEKCIKMKTALNAQILKPELICKKSHSHINCMQWIQAGTADISVFDAGDIYTGGLSYDLVPFMSEIYNLGEPEYYVVAVAKEDDPDTELTYLKGKNTCHTGINTGAGWTYPMAYLISNGWIRPYGCDSVRAAAEYFSKSCIPGAISSEYNTGVPYDNMCDLCHGTSYHYCRRDSSEDYFGHTGAFRCLVEGGGHVAFVKHTTVMESTGGKRKEWWARNTLNDDFELLCTDGTRAELHDYKKCNLGKIKANAVVTRGGHNYNETQLKAYINLLAYAQQLYGRKNVDAFSFSMFTSPVGYYDLIFQDATRQLQIIPPHLRRYDRYLGQNFLRARRITDCYAGSSKVSFSVSVYFLVFFIVFY